MAIHTIVRETGGGVSEKVMTTFCCPLFVTWIDSAFSYNCAAYKSTSLPQSRWIHRVCRKPHLLTAIGSRTFPILFPRSIIHTSPVVCSSLTPEYSWKEKTLQVEQIMARLESFRFREPSKAYDRSIPRWRRFSLSLEHDIAILPPPGTCAANWYNKRIRSAAAKRDLKRVLALIREMKFNSNITKPDTVTYATALSCCAKMRAVEEARKLWTWYIEDVLPVDNHVYSSMIAVYARTIPPQYDSAWFIFQQLKSHLQPNKVVYNAMIDICSRSGKMEEALQLFEEIKSQVGEKPDEYTYNALLKGYARAGNVQSAIQVSNQMHSEGIIPRAITYSVLIDSLGKCKKLDEAFMFFEEMEAKGIQPNIITFNVLLSACAASNNYSRALVIVDWMEQRGIAFDRYTFNGLIQSAVNSKHYEEAVRWYEKMIHSQVIPNNVTFRYLVEAAGGLIRFDLIKLSRWHMEQLHVKGNSYTYAALVASSLRCKQLEAAQAFLNEFELSRRRDQRFYDIIVEILHRLGEYQQAKIIISHKRIANDIS